MKRARLTRVPAVLALVAAPLALALALPLAACTGDDDGAPATVTVTAPVDGGDASAGPTPATGPTPGVTQSPTDVGPIPGTDPTDDAPFVANTEPDVGTGTAGALVTPTDMRYGRHDGYDRVVIDLAGTGTPGWRAEYVDSPQGQASGEVVDVDGAAYLDVMVTDVAYPGEDGQPEYAGPDAIVAPSGGVIREVRFAGVFEGTMQVVIGLDATTPFRVYALTDPTRLVIDAQLP